MKEFYENLNLEVIRFRTEDVIATSEARNPVPVQPVDNQTTDGGNTESGPTYTYYDSGTVYGLPEGPLKMDLYSLGAGGGSLGDPRYVNYNGEWVKVVPDNVLEDNGAWHVATS